jgi:hypothetical protein
LMVSPGWITAQPTVSVEQIAGTAAVLGPQAVRIMLNTMTAVINPNKRLFILLSPLELAK